MRHILFFAAAALAAGAASGWTIQVPSMPVSPYADTEVSTNIPINKADIGYSDLNFRLNGTPTNNLELAFGTDANTNGVLDAEEVETRLGWRGGRYFVENARTWEMCTAHKVAVLVGEAAHPSCHERVAHVAGEDAV